MKDRLQTQLLGGFRKGELVVIAAALRNENKSKLNIVKPTTEVLSTMCREIKARQLKVGTVNNEVQDPQ